MANRSSGSCYRPPRPSGIRGHHAAILTLPAELMVHILSHVVPPDIPHVLSACKRFLSYARLIIPRALRASFSDTQLNTALCFIAQRGYISHYDKGVRWLVKAGACVDSQMEAFKMETPLYMAANGGYMAMAKALIQNGADVDRTVQNNQSPLYACVVNKNLGMVELLVQSHADLEIAEDSYGATPLNVASCTGMSGVLMCLLHAGANVNHEAKEGRRSIHVACTSGSSAAVAALCAHGADVNVQDVQGRTPLYFATFMDCIESVRVLLDNKADANLSFPHRDSPLHIACKTGNCDIVQALLQAKADVNRVGACGNTPLQVAREHGHRDVIEALMSASADDKRCK